MDDSIQFLSSLSPRIKTNKKVNCKGPTLLSLKNYFRKSLLPDHSKATVPNHSLSIIEISSTDSGSTRNSNVVLKIISESDNQSCTTPSFKPDKQAGIISNSNTSDEEIISPSPQKKDISLKWLSTERKKVVAKTAPNGVLPKVKLFEIEKWVEDVNKSTEKNKGNTQQFFEASVLNYEDFEKRTKNKNYHVVNSTLLFNNTSSKENGDIAKKIKDDKSYDSDDVCNKSCEDLLDKVYGGSWRLKKKEILPSSERKIRRKAFVPRENIPKSERKPKKLQTYPNPYFDREKERSNHLLKILQTKRIKEAIESPFIMRLNALCDKESDEEPNMKFIARQKLSFSEDKDDIAAKIKLHQPIDRQVESWADNDRLTTQMKLCEADMCNLTLSDKENSISDEIVPLADRIKKKWSKPIKEQGDKVKTKQNTHEENSLKLKETEQATNNINSKGRGRKERKKLYHNGSSSDESSKKKCILSDKDNFVKPKLKSKPLTKSVNGKATLSSSSSTGTNSSNKIPEDVDDIKNSGKKRITRKKTAVNYVDSSDSGEDCTKYNSVQKEQTTISAKGECYSFLASLSKNIPDSQCNLSAKIFRNNYKQYKETLATKLFNLYNEKVFNNVIPEATSLEWNDRMLSTAGYCYSKKITHRNGQVDREARIVLSSKVLDSADRLRDTLIHEMCHAATWIVDHASGHGDHWKAWAAKAKRAFPELPAIKTCHNYQINTKYVYRCVDCGYSIGRHRKSLDIERKRCGYCLGKFEVLINKTNKKGERNTVPVKPKKEPTGFALFVKENYSNFKAPGKRHAEVMRLLSEKFNEMKV